jgi:hypothetical protein
MWVLAITLLIGGEVVVFVFAPNGEDSRLYPQSGCLYLGCGALAFLFSLWLLCVLGKRRWTGNGPGPCLISWGRLTVWLLATAAFGESIWLLAYLPGTGSLVSYRLFTIWAVLALLALVVLVGSLLDTWQSVTRMPCRLMGLFLGAFLLFALRAPAPEPLALKGAGEEGVKPDEYQWAKVLLERVRNVPAGEPAVFVAASGGGSRAAIFTGLTLEFLARTPFANTDTFWGDHVVLISGVSGGSLGTARYVHGLGDSDWSSGQRRTQLRNSVIEELAARMVPTSKQLRDHFLDQKQRILKPDIKAEADQETRELRENLLQATESAFAEAVEYCACFEKDPRHPPTPPWVVQSGLMDDLCTDFMAPVLRGVLTPGVSRGECLRHFWGKHFDWGSSDDRTGYDFGGTRLTYDGKRFPLAIFNACDVRRGCRVAIGFPPLPKEFLRSPETDGPTLYGTTRHSPETLADIDPFRSIYLAQAVGLSANFPLSGSTSRRSAAPPRRRTTRRTPTPSRSTAASWTTLALTRSSSC